jgi:anti-anti-sigma factor
MLNVQANRLGTVAVLAVQGQIVNGETETLRNTLHSLPESLSGVRAVKLDLARVTTIDAHGLGVMLALREQVQSGGMRFELMNVNQRIRTVLELTRLDSVFKITSGAECLPAVTPGLQVSSARLSWCA